jgi:TRAP transporter TAXI family solute receptor
MSDHDPRRRKRKNTLFSFIGIVLLLVSVVAGVTYVATRPVMLRIAVGASDNNDKKLIQAIAARFANDHNPIRLSIIETEGGAESLAFLAASKADVAVARGDLDLPRDAQSLAIFRKNVVVLWAPAGLRRKRAVKSKIEEIGDLAGRRIGLVGRGDENLRLLKVILTESGVAPEEVKVSQFRADQIGQMTHDPGLDAFMTVGPLDSRITSEAIALTAARRGEPTFLPIDGYDAIAQKHPLYQSGKIPGHVFAAKPARPDGEIETVSVNDLFVARSFLPDAAAGALTRHLLAARQSLSRDNPDAAKIEKPDTDKDASLPAHPGAAAYIDGTERTFLERYSDYFWAGILLLSVIGSAGAWIGHYLKRDEKDLNTVHRDKLLGAMTRVREASSESALTALQTEIDAVLRETLDCYDDGAVDEGGLMALSLVLDRLHGAIVDRRAELAAYADNSASFGIPRPGNRIS